MKVLFVAAEMEPIAKVGGLADVIGSLPEKLSELGCDVRIVIPFYREVKNNLRRYKLKAKTLKEKFTILVGRHKLNGIIEELSLGSLKIYLLNNDNLYDREFIYSTPQGQYKDNDLRFGFLSLGALEIVKTLNFKPNIIHCHDWHTALLPIALKCRKDLREEPFFKKSKIVFTIHNIAYQGLFSKGILDKFKITSSSSLKNNGTKLRGKVNLLKGGILYSHLVTTVSPSYAEELKKTQYSTGLNNILRKTSEQQNKLIGIMNGIDYDHWNPKTDRALYVNYDTNDITMKTANKIKLKQMLGFNSGNDKPLLGMVSRLTYQKGMDLVVDSLKDIFEMGFQLVIQGSGDEKIVNILKRAQEKHRKNLSVISKFDDVIARRIYASSDIFLMPSRFEPCGLSNIIALRYGSIPIVRGTGGLLDSMRDYTVDKTTGNGFIFHKFSKPDLLYALSRALSVFENKVEWSRLVTRAMKEDFSWKKSSKKYLELYKTLLSKK